MDRLLCVDVGGSWIKSSLVDPTQVGEIEERQAPQTADELTGLLAELVRQNGEQAAGWSLALPGSCRGQRYWSDSAAYQLMGQEIDIWQHLQRQGIPAPLSLANDVFAAARGEALTQPEERRLIVVNIGTGLASCLAVDGWPQPHQESGHVTYQPDGPQCGCGRQGCYEAIVGWKALKQRSGAATPAELKQKLSPDEIDEAIGALSHYLASMIAVRGVDKIVMTGGCWEGFYKAYQTQIEERTGELYLHRRPAQFLTGGGRVAVMRGLYDLGHV